MMLHKDEHLYTVGFQGAVDRWCRDCFGPTVTLDLRERADRLIEEALELAQTMPGFTRERAHNLVDYVFNRPAGEMSQELGGTMVCLAALANATNLSIGTAANKEISRVMKPDIMLKVRDKQAMKRLIHK